MVCTARCGLDVRPTQLESRGSSRNGSGPRKAVSPEREPRARGTPSREPNRRTPGSTAIASGSSGSAGLVDAAWASGHRATLGKPGGASGRKAGCDRCCPRHAHVRRHRRSASHPLLLPASAGRGSLRRATGRTADRHAWWFTAPGPTRKTALGAASPALGRAAESPSAMRVQVCRTCLHASQVHTHIGKGERASGVRGQRAREGRSAVASATRPTSFAGDASTDPQTGVG